MANGVDNQFIEKMKDVITTTFFKVDGLSVKGSLIPKVIVQRQFAKLNSFMLQSVAEQYAEASRVSGITDANGYMASMIYNSISGEYLTMTSRVNYEMQGNGRTRK